MSTLKNKLWSTLVTKKKKCFWNMFVPPVFLGPMLSFTEFFLFYGAQLSCEETLKFTCKFTDIGFLVLWN
jgi:hypothetical protein